MRQFFSAACVLWVSVAALAQEPAPVPASVSEGANPAPSSASASASASAMAAPSAIKTDEEAKPRSTSVAVLDLKASEQVDGTGKALTALISSEVGGVAGYTAISRNELKALISHQADVSLLGCTEAACAADIATLANADRVIAGTLTAVEGGAVVLALTLIDPHGPTVLDRASFTWRSNVDDMLELARPAVTRLLRGAEAATLTGDLDILAPEGAAVTVDGKEVGTAPVGVVRGLPIGVHAIELRKGGYVPLHQDVAISHNETKVTQLDMIDEASLQPWYARWYVWGSAIAGVAVVGGAVAGVVAYNSLTAPSRLVIGEKL